MGLDVAAYTQVEKADPRELDDHPKTNHEWEFPDSIELAADDEGWVRVWLNPHYPNQQEELEDAYYKTAEQFYFRAGSYSGYNRYRENLCQMALGIVAPAVWEAFKQDNNPFEGKPFVEQINFSDCEGVIGPKTSAKLTKDYQDYMAKAEQELDEYDFQTYKNFAKAFAMASDGGFVDYH